MSDELQVPAACPGLELAEGTLVFCTLFWWSGLTQHLSTRLKQPWGTRVPMRHLENRQVSGRRGLQSLSPKWKLLVVKTAWITIPLCTFLPQQHEEHSVGYFQCLNAQASLRLAALSTVCQPGYPGGGTMSTDASHRGPVAHIQVITRDTGHGHTADTSPWQRTVPGMWGCQHQRGHPQSCTPKFARRCQQQWQPAQHRQRQARIRSLSEGITGGLGSTFWSQAELTSKDKLPLTALLWRGWVCMEISQKGKKFGLLMVTFVLQMFFV